jgi:hypothetical protein
MRSAAETPETVMRYATEGRMSKQLLTSLLTPQSRPSFLAACAEIENAYTVACATSGNPCLSSGCSCEGEVCLEPLLRAGAEYQRKCGTEWAKLFADEHRRDGTWRLTVSN